MCELKTISDLKIVLENSGTKLRHKQYMQREREGEREILNSISFFTWIACLGYHRHLTKHVMHWMVVHLVLFVLLHTCFYIL